jgi:hypothetical protein
MLDPHLFNLKLIEEKYEIENVKFLFIFISFTKMKKLESITLTLIQNFYTVNLNLPKSLPLRGHLNTWNLYL